MRLDEIGFPDTNEVVLPELIRDCLANGVPVTLKAVDGELAFVLDGFYKSGTARLTLTPDGTWLCHSRWDRTTEVSEFADLVAENAFWWQVTAERCGSSPAPDPAWKPHLVDHGYIQERVETRYISAAHGNASC